MDRGPRSIKQVPNAERQLWSKYWCQTRNRQKSNVENTNWSDTGANQTMNMSKLVQRGKTDNLAKTGDWGKV